MNNILVFDTEDNSPELERKRQSGFKKQITQIAAKNLDGVEYYDKRPSRFLHWLEKQSPALCYAHNLQYDLGALFADSLDSLELNMVGSRIISARWKGIEFRDSMNIWNCSVADLGEAFGLKKLKQDVHSKEYVFRDVDIVLKSIEFLLAMVKEYGLKHVPRTLGSLSVALWKALGGENIPNDSPFCREGLYGGRVELFRPDYDGLISWTDLNSLYPSVMLNKFPDDARDFTDLPEYGAAGVRLAVPESFIAPLPVRTEDGSIQYPCGKIEGIWTCHEIRAAVKRGAKIEKLYDIVGSNRGEYYYRDFVREFYKLRLATQNPAKKLFYKLCMNNLYGQLGMRGIRTKTAPMSSDYSGPCFGSKKLIDDTNVHLPKHVNYLHAAYVTSYGRLRLNDYLYRLGERMIYCDTDSCIFTGKADFPLGTGLGEMKLEGEGSHCEMILPKTYVFDSEYVAKGVPKKHAEKFIRNKTASWRQPFKIKEAVRFYDRGNAKKLSIWRKVSKRICSEYKKKELREGKFFPKIVCNYAENVQDFFVF